MAIIHGCGANRNGNSAACIPAVSGQNTTMSFFYTCHIPAPERVACFSLQLRCNVIGQHA